MIVFAYGGAELMVEMLSEMENPADFSKSINFSFLILIFFYYVGKKSAPVVIVASLVALPCLFSSFLFLRITMRRLY